MTPQTTKTADLRDTHEIQELIETLHRKYQPLTDGEVATYIPELSQANPEHFGICLATAAGQVFTTGDCQVPFTIQSVSKPFVFGLALEQLVAVPAIATGPSHTCCSISG